MIINRVRRFLFYLPKGEWRAKRIEIYVDMRRGLVSMGIDYEDGMPEAIFNGHALSFWLPQIYMPIKDANDLLREVSPLMQKLIDSYNTYDDGNRGTHDECIAAEIREYLDNLPEAEHAKLPLRVYEYLNGDFCHKKKRYVMPK